MELISFAFLDMFQASCKEQKHLPQNVSSKDEESSILLTSRMLVAIGLMNDTTEFDNFLSAIIQVAAPYQTEFPFLLFYKVFTSSVCF